MNILKAVFICSVAFALSFTHQAQATLIWDNGLINSGNSSGGGYCSDCGQSGYQVYDSFVLSVDSSISSLDVGLSSFAQNAVTFAIYDAPNGNSLWQGVYDWTGGLHGQVSTYTYNVLGFSVGGLNLNAGQYWFSFYGIHTHNAFYQGADGGLTQCINNVCYDRTPYDVAFRLYGNSISVVEPSTILLFGLGLLGLGYRRRKQMRK